jgi:hypothetical protein
MIEESFYYLILFAIGVANIFLSITKPEAGKNSEPQSSNKGVVVGPVN